MNLEQLKGNAKEYAQSNVLHDSTSPLNGKTIIFLGSSVTYGYGSLGTSFVEYLAKKDGVIPIKEAVSGTTLVDQSADSYIPRMELINKKINNKEIKVDAFICQLSTNDATQNKPLGNISESFSRSDFDVTTVAGAIEYIISYAKANWKCPVLFYTGTRYESKEYEAMVQLLLQIQKKWDCGVIDLWNDEKLNAIDDELRELYMLDGIHPTRAGYLKWWLPKIEHDLESYL